MFEGFEMRKVAGAGADIHMRIGGDGPPLLLLHGFPQTGAMWATIAPALAQRFRLFVPDMRGYGQSSTPDSKGGSAYTKRVMAQDMVAAMQALGHERFAVAGHDRGARVAYRMALDHPSTISRLAVLDILPTAEVWRHMNAEEALETYHWMFLAQPNPMPERLIGSDAVFYLDHTIASWTKSHALAPFSSEALAEYRRSFARGEYIHAACEDYRAGATEDRRLDEEDLASGRRIAAPTLALWGSHGIAASVGDVLAVWRGWCENVEGEAVDCGHFVVEEAPEPVTRALVGFFSQRG